LSSAYQLIPLKMKILSVFLLLALLATTCLAELVQIPLSRSGLMNRKTAIRAAQGNPQYRRLMEHSYHGASMNRKLRSKHSKLSGLARSSLPSSALSGCPFSDFTVPISIGGTSFSLIADTGSSTLAIAGSSCSTCSGVSPLWKSTSTSTNTGYSSSGEYGDNSGWLGTVWADTVSFASTSYNSQINLVVINSQSTNGHDANGGTDAQAGPFFTTDACQDDTVVQRNSITNQGIVGLAFDALATAHTNGITQALMKNYPSLNSTFAIQVCEHSGNMWLGGYDPTTIQGNLYWTSLVSPGQYYSVTPAYAFIGNTQLNVNANSWGNSGNIVDSGTTLMDLPTDVYNAVVSALNNNAQFNTYFGSSFWTTTTCVTPNGAVSASTLKSQLPTFTVQFSDNLIVTMDGVGSYLMPCDGSYTSYAPGISYTSSTGIFGWSFMNQFVVVHDLANMRIGFGVTSQCPLSTPLNAYVSSSQLFGTLVNFTLSFNFSTTPFPSGFSSDYLPKLASAANINVLLVSETLTTNNCTSSSNSSCTTYSYWVVSFSFTRSNVSTDILPTAALSNLQTSLNSTSSVLYTGTYGTVLIKGSLDTITQPGGPNSAFSLHSSQAMKTILPLTFAMAVLIAVFFGTN
jgi:hypothetical protein